MAYLSQSTKRIEVIVRKGGEQGLQGAKEAEPEKPAQDNAEPKDSGGGASPKKSALTARTAVIQAMHLTAAARSIGNQVWQYYYSGQGYKTGDSAYQDSVERTVEVASSAVNLSTSILMGALYGMRGGPIGIVVGATSAAAITGGNIISRKITREREFSVKEYKLNNEIEYKRARAGINLTTGRLR